VRVIKLINFDIKILSRLHGGSPSLPYSLWEGAKEQISPQLPAWLNDSFELGPIASGSNGSNELVHTIDFGPNDGNQFLTSWIDQDVELQPLKRRIQDKLGISTQCRPLIQFNLTNSNNQSENEVLSDVNISQNISGFRPLSKNNLDAGHKVSFFFNDTLAEVPVNCVDETKNKFFFKIDGATDVGGTLDFVIFNATTQMCLTQNRPDANNVCDNEVKLYHNQSFYMPQPAPGIWFLELKPLDCTGAHDEVIAFNLTLDGCVNKCGEHEGRGSCSTFYTQGGFLMSSCQCKAGFKGISCSDESDAMSIQVQLLELLLLTLSNLFFLPAILISIHRRYWQEAIVFTIAMCCSTVYHACDQFSTQKYYCIADYDTLQFADFLAATSAMWVTVLAVADLPQRWAAVMQNTGVFMFSIGAHYNRFSVWLFAAPIVIGMAILMGHWIYQCRVRRDCYPLKSAWICHLLPGLLFAAGGFLTKIIFEFEGMHGNYYWTHTLWHAFLGLSCAFLLPDISYDSTKMYNPDSNNLISYYKSFDEPNFEPNVL
jgi:hypothetical protein